jgi:hypothetical protein
MNWEEEEKNEGHWWESHREGHHHQDFGGWTILRWLLERQNGMLWAGLVQLRTGKSEELL